MADTLTRRSPLHGYETRFANLPQAATVAEEPFVAMVDLWVDPAGPGGAAAAGVLGVDALPTAPSTTVSGGDVTVIWLGPQEWLVTSERRDGEEPRVDAARRGIRTRWSRDRRFRTAHDAAAAGRARAGRHRQGLLAGLHPAVFGPGRRRADRPRSGRRCVDPVERQRNRLPHHRAIVVRRVTSPTG